MQYFNLNKDFDDIDDYYEVEKIITRRNDLSFGLTGSALCAGPFLLRCCAPTGCFFVIMVSIREL